MEHANAQALSDERLQTFADAVLVRIDRPDRNELRQRQKPAQAHVDNDATAVRLEDESVDHTPALLHLLELDPLAVIASPTERQNDPALQVCGLHHNSDHVLADA